MVLSREARHDFLVQAKMTRHVIALNKKIFIERDESYRDTLISARNALLACMGCD